VPGPAILTPALVVGLVRFGETSRVVRLATEALGLQVAMAKGVTRRRSPFVALQLLAEGTAHLIPGRGEMATLTGFDATDAHVGLARTLTAFHAASVLAEVAARALPSDHQPELYQALRRGVRLIEAAPAAAADVAGLAAIWRFVVALGLAPSLARCARDGGPLGAGPTTFSVEDGGLLCDRCAAGGGGAILNGTDRAALAFLVTGDGEPPDLDRRHVAAHRRLLGRWITRHLDNSRMSALDQWIRGDDSPTEPT
jgi:DNA repair protein RecO (recombination protein O)